MLYILSGFFCSTVMTHVLVSTVFSYCCIEFHYKNILQFNHSVVGGHLIISSFWLLGIMLQRIFFYVFGYMCVWLFVGYMPGSGIGRSLSVNTAKRFSRDVAPFILVSAIYVNFIFFTSSPVFNICWILLCTGVRDTIVNKRKSSQRVWWKIYLYMHVKLYIFNWPC